MSYIKRWLVYLLVGLLFGIFDFYYQELTASIVHSFIAWFTVAWGIWLVPAIPIVWHELKVSKSKIKAALANVFVWVITTFSYYFFLAFKLIFIGQESRQEMYILNYKADYYLNNLKALFFNDVFRGIRDWLGIAIVCGFIFGYCFSFFVGYIRKSKI